MEYEFTYSDGVKIYYHERGHGEPLLLIMGFGADGTLWEKHAAVYEKHFRCIIPDNRGVGRSDQPAGPYHTRQMAEDALKVLEHAGEARAHVAGISMGGAIAQEIAINYPEKVDRLLLVSTWGKFNEYTASIYQNLKHIRSQVTPGYFMELLQLWIFAPPYFESHVDELKSGVKAAASNPAPQSQKGFEGQLDACIHHDSIDRLHLIRSPTLITVGSMDIFTPPAFSEVLHHHIPQSDLQAYPGGGHVHHWECLEKFNQETLNFLKNKQL